MALEKADLLLAYDWPYDGPFLVLLERQLSLLGQSLVGVNPQRLADTFSRLQAG